MNILKIRTKKVRKILSTISLKDLEKLTSDDDNVYKDNKLIHIVGDMLVLCASRPTLTEKELETVLSFITGLFSIEILMRKGFIKYTLYERDFKVEILNYEMMKDIVLPSALA